MNKEKAEKDPEAGFLRAKLKIRAHHGKWRFSFWFNLRKYTTSITAHCHNVNDFMFQMNDQSYCKCTVGSLRYRLFSLSSIEVQEEKTGKHFKSVAVISVVK